MKIISIIFIVIGFSVSAHARKIGQAGCGLGNNLLGSDPGATQIIGATTNGFYGNQTFGITSGTSGCLDSMNSASLENFVDANQVALNNDMSRGQGETLNTLGRMLSCENQEAVSTSLKQSYPGLSGKNSKELSVEIKSVLKNTPAAACKSIG